MRQPEDLEKASLSKGHLARTWWVRFWLFRKAWNGGDIPGRATACAKVLWQQWEWSAGRTSSLKRKKCGWIMRGREEWGKVCGVGSADHVRARNNVWRIWALVLRAEKNHSWMLSIVRERRVDAKYPDQSCHYHENTGYPVENRWAVHQNKH